MAAISVSTGTVKVWTPKAAPGAVTWTPTWTPGEKGVNLTLIWSI